jgi:hypothetical protein
MTTNSQSLSAYYINTINAQPDAESREKEARDKISGTGSTGRRRRRRVVKVGRREGEEREKGGEGDKVANAKHGTVHAGRANQVPGQGNDGKLLRGEREGPPGSKKRKSERRHSKESTNAGWMNGGKGCFGRGGETKSDEEGEKKRQKGKKGEGKMVWD